MKIGGSVSGCLSKSSCASDRHAGPFLESHVNGLHGEMDRDSLSGNEWLVLHGDMIDTVRSDLSRGDVSSLGRRRGDP